MVIEAVLGFGFFLSYRLCVVASPLSRVVSDKAEKEAQNKDAALDID